MLTVNNATLKFGGLTAVDNVSFQVDEGEIFSIIGPNGAGKTSLFNTISGVYKLNSGEILINGENISKRWQNSDYILAILTGLIVSFLIVLFLNIDQLWQAVINKHLSIKPFPWTAALSELVDFPWSDSTFISAIGFLVGLISYIAIFFNSTINPQRVAKLNVARTFQNIRLFKSLSILDNLLLSMDKSFCNSYLNALIRGPKFHTFEGQAKNKASEIFQKLDLIKAHTSLPTSHSYGSQRRIEIARALATHPKLLLLDEPAAGMNPTETSKLMDYIKRIRQSGITIVLIEHHMNLVMGISDRILVLHHGSQIALGTPSEIQNNERVIEAYLGKGSKI